MSYVSVEKDKNNIVTITLDDPDRPVNVMSARYIEEMELAVDQLQSQVDDVAGIIIASAKKTFFAGGDLDELLALKKEDMISYAGIGLRIKATLRKLETLGKPVVAAINGAALGGGFEICLACHHRVAIDQRGVSVGLPEVTLGLLPGAGGVIRMVRLLGLQAAMPHLMEGRALAASAALDAGLVDELASDASSMIAKAKAWILANPQSAQAWDLDGWEFPGGNVKSPQVENFIPVASAKLKGSKKGLYPAPKAIFKVAVDSMRVDFESASRIESRNISVLACTPEAKNMITHFFQMQKVQGGASRPKDFERHKFSRVGIIGAGMMGAGIAYSAAAAGIQVVLKDVELESAQRGKDYSDTVVSSLIKKGKSSEQDKAAILERISVTDDMLALKDCELVIEAVFEKQALKEGVIRDAEAVLADSAIFATNTSTLPITGLAKSSARSENYIGLHFFSPVDKMRLVEIICGEQTSDATLAKAFDFVKQIRKVPIVVNDSRSFFTSRVYETYQDEGAWLLEDGVKPALIENLAQLAGLPVGPLAANDEVAQRLILEIKNSIREGVEAEGGTYPDDEPPYVWCKRMVEEFSRLGKASGAGYYDYPVSARKLLWPELESIQPSATRVIANEDISDRLMFRQCVEAVRCVEEGVLRSVPDGNIGSMLGLGFPAYTGGMLQYVNSYGLKAFAERARDLAQEYGNRFEPPKLLWDMIDRGETFK